MRTRVAWRNLPWGIALAVAVRVDLARGQDSRPVRLEWDAPESCPTTEEVLARVDRIVGESTARRQQTVEARAVVSRIGGQWRVVLSTRARGAEGERDVDAATCPALADAVALILSLAASPSEPEPAEPPAPAQPAPRPAPRRLLALSLQAVFAAGLLPDLATGGEAAIAVLPWRLRFELGGDFWANQTAGVPSSTTETAQFSLASGVVRAGYVASVGRFELVPSFVLAANFTSAVARNVTAPNPNSSTWLAAGAEAAVYYRLTPLLEVRLGLDAALPLARPTFGVTQGASRQEVFQPSAVGGKGTIGLELRLL